ncbi:hypothetical protein AA106_19635 [Photorhabdus laumondii subsp. laumondii]|uniref:hypothetical protein n=1 Tax=Photorhabdus laumondii TaxID=2218628 RepID=UPI0007337EFA|nr:hypothetical protein [Photorhabdus laumondii]KTL62680.1 hypothetical protein AA106_19635 [Photorhabdus laumondii subsp. laumondii]
MTLEKISFAYPVHIRQGMLIDVMHPPSMWIYADSFPSVEYLNVALGVFLRKDELYYTKIDVFFDDKSVLDDQDKGNDTAYIHLSGFTSTDQYIMVSSMTLKRVHLPNEGVYKLIVELYSGELGSADSKVIYPMDFEMHRDGKGANPREHR